VKEDELPKTFKQMTDEAMAAVPGITPEEAYRRQQADPNLLLIDVLDLADRKRMGQPAGAVPISAGMLAFRADHETPERHRDPRLQDRTHPIVTICGGGPLSAIGAQTLQEIGFTDVAYVQGGTRAWQEAGLPLESPHDE
jgi:rhodanese-related sulfurtransferase